MCLSFTKRHIGVAFPKLYMQPLVHWMPFEEYISPGGHQMINWWPASQFLVASYHVY